MQNVFEQLSDKLKELGFEADGDDVAISGIDNVQVWESPYAVVLGVEVNDSNDAEEFGETWSSAQYFLDVKLSDLERKNAIKDAFLVFVLPEDPTDLDTQDLMMRAKYNVSVCKKDFVTEDNATLNFTEGLELQGVGRKPTPSELSVEKEKLPLDAQVTVIEGHNATTRPKVEKALRRELKGTGAALFVTPLDGMDEMERIDWIYRLRTTALLNPDTKIVVTTRSASARQLIQQRFIHIGSEDEPSLRIVRLHARVKNEGRLTTELQKVIKPLELSLQGGGSSGLLTPPSGAWRN